MWVPEGQRRLSSKGCYMVHLQLAKWVGAGENVLVTTPIIIKMTRENSEVVDMDIAFTIVMISQIYRYLQTDQIIYFL